MKIDKEFLTVLLKERYGIFPIVRKNAEDVTKDMEGSSSTSLASSLRFIGLTEYLLYNDIESFKTNLTESARIYKQLLVRYNSDDPIDPSYVTMIRYKNLFDALAVGNLQLAKEFGVLMGGRDEIEKKYDHPFDYAFGYALKSFVLNNRVEMERYCDEFSEVCRGGGNFDFAGYAQMFKAIINQDSAEANKALASIVKGHVRQSKGRGVFKDTENEWLCIWGIGIVNLAKSYGLEVQPLPPLIPEDLLI